MRFNQRGDLSTLNSSSLKLVDKFTYQGSSVSSTETDINTWLTKAWAAINRLSIIWKSDLIDKIKRSFFQAAVRSILLYGCTTWTLTKRMEKKLDGNYTWMLQAILNKSWRQHPTKQQLYGHLPPVTKSIQVRRTRHAGHCWRSRDELISDILLWIPSHGRAKAGWPFRTDIQQLCADTGCSLEDRPEEMDDREEWWERVREIRADGVTWWWDSIPRVEIGKNRNTNRLNCPVGWGCRIHRLLLCRGVRAPPQTSILDMTLNNLMMRFQQCWSSGECGVPLHCHCSQAHSGPEW